MLRLATIALSLVLAFESVSWAKEKKLRPPTISPSRLNTVNARPSIRGKVHEQEITNLKGKPIDLKQGVEIGTKFEIKIVYTIPVVPNRPGRIVRGSIVFIRPDGSFVVMQGKAKFAKLVEEGKHEVVLTFEAFRLAGTYQIQIDGRGFMLATIPIKIIEKKK